MLSQLDEGHATSVRVLGASRRGLHILLFAPTIIAGAWSLGGSHGYRGLRLALLVASLFLAVNS